MPDEHTPDNSRTPPSATGRAPEDRLGIAVGPYRLAGVLGRSEASPVYEAVDPHTQRRVAVKQLPDALARDPDVLERVLADARAAGQLDHPNLVAAYDAEPCDGDTFLVMEFVGGGSAAERIAALGRQPWREATRLVADACRGLAAAHAAGLVHGNVKPGNLLITHDGKVKVADFGLAAAGGGPAYYRSPEQCRGEPPDARSDVYALGATYFALLTGRPPPGVESEEIDGHQSKPVPTVRAGAPEIPLRCDAIIQKAMAPDPDDRYPSAAALLADLEAVRAADDTARPLPRPVIPRPRPWWKTWRDRLRPLAVPAAAVAALAVAGYFVLAMRPPRAATKSSEAAAGGKPATALPTVTNGIGMKLARVPAGVFVMGDPFIADARPHLVRISHGFLVGVHEVTQREYQFVMGTNPSQFRGEQLPVEQVTWDEARAFCAKLSERPEEKALGRVYRLPTEAEWEYCCRAGTRTAFHCGAQLTPQQANMLLGGFPRTTPVGTYPPNAWGLYDLHGNVAEWCADWYGAESYATGGVIDPTGPAEGTKRVTRGGAWLSPPEDCRCGHRDDTCPPEFRGPGVGFRVVCTEAAGGL